METGGAGVTALVIAGIRSQFMKLAAFQRAQDRWNATRTPRVDAIYVNSGQHYDDELAGRFIKELAVRFDHDLTRTYAKADPIHLLGEMIASLYDLCVAYREEVDWVVVFGDANTTLAGALAGVKAQIPVAHVESGLRLGSLLSSPEEVNRVVSDHLAQLHLVSSKADWRGIQAEGLQQTAEWTGDLIRDLVEDIAPAVAAGVDGHPAGSYVFATLHREENLSSPTIVDQVVKALSESPYPVLFATHPRTRRVIVEENNGKKIGSIEFFEGLSYEETLAAMKGARFLFTDSGALQRESFYLGKRCIVRQDKPYWISLVEAGVHCACGRTAADVSTAFEWAEQALASPYPPVDDFGDGRAGERIWDALLRNKERVRAQREA